MQHEDIERVLTSGLTHRDQLQVLGLATMLEHGFEDPAHAAKRLLALVGTMGLATEAVASLTLEMVQRAQEG